MILKLSDNYLSYQLCGEGKPLILLHGNGENSSIFDCIIKQLSKHFTIYAIDSRNHGKSSVTGEISYELMADDLIGFISKLDLQHPYVLGFSDGAIVALLAELDHPDIFAKMILLGINLQPSDFLEHTYNDILNEHDETHSPLLALMINEPNISLESLRNVNCPILLINGENDIFRKDLVTDILRMLPDGAVIEIKGHTHESYIMHNDLIADVVVEFLNNRIISKKNFFTILSNKSL